MRSLEKVKISGAQPYLQSTLELHDCPGEHQRVSQFSGVLQRVHYSPDKIELADDNHTEYSLHCVAGVCGPDHAMYG